LDQPSENLSEIDQVSAPVSVSKPVWASKTYGANIGANMLVAAAMEISPAIASWVATHPQTLILLISAMNIGLRHVSTTQLTFKS
jgi:hypothetical protein